MWLTACDLKMYTEIIHVDYFKFGVRNPMLIEIYRSSTHNSSIIIVILIKKLLIT